MIGVTISELSRSFGTVPVLHGIDMAIEPGEFTVLLGPSGCGKSTLLSSIAGLDDLQGGSVHFDGEDVTDLEPAARGIGMVFQSYALYPTMTVRKNMSFGLEVARTSKREIEERVAWAAKLLRIEPLLERKPRELSGGQRQRVAIGRALVRKASLFLFDEPLSNLDAKLRTEMRVEIKELHKRLGATFIYVTHDQVEAMTLATRIAVMHGGRIEQYASPEEVFERPASLFVAGFIGSPPMNLMPAYLEKRGSAWAVRTGEGHLVLPAYDFDSAPREGPAVMGIRPENMQINSVSADTSWNATVKLVEPLGSDTLVWIECDGQRLAVRMAPREARTIGDQVSVSFAPDALSLFSPDTGQRL